MKPELQHVAYLYYGKMIAEGTPDKSVSCPMVQQVGNLSRRNPPRRVNPALTHRAHPPRHRSATIFGQYVASVINDDLDLDHCGGCC